jgi:hypothetical protein
MAHDGNNAELQTLIYAPEISSRQGYTKLVVERDCQLINHMLHKLQIGSSAMKVYSNSKLEYGVEDLPNLIPQITALLHSSNHSSVTVAF